MIFEFDQRRSFAQNIDVEDIGQCALMCTSAKYEDYYICTQTVMGKTFVLKFGPIFADIDELSENFSLEYKKIDYKENKIIKEINLLINDPKKQIVQIQAIELTDLLSKLPSSDRFIPA